MRISEVKKILVDIITPIGDKYGAKVVKRDVSLNYSHNGMNCGITFTYNLWDDEKQIFPYVEIDCPTMHRICDQVGFHLNHTCFINLFVLETMLKGKWKEDTAWQLQCENKDRFIVTDLSQLDDYKVYLSNLISMGIEWSRQIDSIQKIDEMFNIQYFKKKNPFCSGFDTHMFIGSIAARLAQNPQSKKIYDTYFELMKKKDLYESTKESFSQLDALLFNDSKPCLIHPE